MEPGVRRLIELVVERGWVTYTSCEGHDYQGAALEPTERAIGLLPRHRAESLAIAATLNQAARDCGQKGHGLRVVIAEGRLIDSLTRARAATLELEFERGELDWQTYFNRVDGTYGLFIEALQRCPVIAAS